MSRIFVVDDSAVMRSLLRTVVTSDPQLEVVGTASDGASALTSLDSLKPDLILLDVEMPVMDGLKTLKHIKSLGHRIPVIMCSALTKRGAQVTIEALANGAADYVAKPSGHASRESAIKALAQDLIPKIHAWIAASTEASASVSIAASQLGRAQGTASGQVSGLVSVQASGQVSGQVSGHVSGPASVQARPSAWSQFSQLKSQLPQVPPTPLPLHKPVSDATRNSKELHTRWAHTGNAEPKPDANPHIDRLSRLFVPSAQIPRPVSPAAGNIPPAVLLIGVSTGGPVALDVVLPMLPANFPLPVLVVQHMPTLFTKLLAERLDSRCSLRVGEATDEEIVGPGKICIAKGDWHMSLYASGSQTRIRLAQDAFENHCRPAVDVLFRSAVDIYGAAILGVILTGMGSDGLIGCRMIRERGGTVFAQDKETSAIWGMPGAVAQAGLAHRILPLNQIVPEILKLTNLGQRAIYSQREASELRESAV